MADIGAGDLVKSRKTNSLESKLWGYATADAIKVFSLLQKFY